MTLAGDLVTLLTARIESRRGEADLRTKRMLEAAKDDAVTRGRLGLGFYAASQEETCADELTARADRWLELSTELLDLSNVFLDAQSANELDELLQQQLQIDFRQMGTLLDQVIRAHGHDHHTGRLRQALERAGRHLRQEVQVLRLRHERERPTDLAVVLAAPRYQAAGVHWQQCLEAQEEHPPDLRRAAAEAIMALESLARVVAGRGATTLGEAVTVLRNDQRLPPGLAKSLDGIWAHASSAAGIRHGAPLPPAVTTGEASYLLNAAQGGIDLMLDLDRKPQI